MNETIIIIIASIFNFSVVRYLIKELMPIFKKNFIDIPNSRSIHTVPKPTGGGIIIVLSSFFTYFFLVLINYAVPEIEGELIFNLWKTLILLIPLSIIGFIDDLYEIKAKIKFGIQIITAILIINFFDINFLNFESGFLFFIFYIGTITFISGLINIVNFMDGIDGLVCGIFSLALFIISIKMNVFLLPLSLGFMGFLNKNWYPSKIFMGDAGSTFLGAIFSVFILQSNSMMEALSVLLLIFPIIMDSIICILRRLVCGQNIFKPHKLHLYQRLVQKGFPHNKVSIIYISSSFLISIFYLTDLLLLQILSIFFIFGLGVYLEKNYAIPFSSNLK